MTPVVARDRLLSVGKLDNRCNLESVGEVLFGAVTLSAPNALPGDLEIRTYRQSGAGYQSILNELALGNVVALKVPSHNNGRAKLDSNDGHYILAYEYDPAVPEEAGEAARILVIDPGFGGTSYGDNPPRAGSIPGYANYSTSPPVSLRDYFAALSHRSGFNYFGCHPDPNSATPDCANASAVATTQQRIEEWFNEGKYYYNGTSGTVSDKFRDQLLTMFEARPIVSGASEPGSTVSAFGPVELLLTVEGTGQRYASDPSLDPEAVVLEKVLADRVAEIDGDESAARSTTLGLPAGEYPGYSLVIPESIGESSVTVSVRGVDQGSYLVSYQPSSSSLQPSMPRAGNIANGQSVEVAFVVNTPPCGGNANTDTIVDFDDIVSVLGNWLADYTPGTGEGDANADSVVDFDDIVAVLANWLNPCP